MRQNKNTRPALPARDGVGASRVGLPPGEWTSMLAFLAHRFPMVSAAEWRVRMQRGDVFDGHGAALPPDAPYRAHGALHYYRHLAIEPHIPFEETVLYQDDFLVAVDKPHFLPVTPAGRYVQETLLVRLKRKLGIDTLAPMHRIDRETAGLVLFSIQPPTRDRYQALFRERSVDKRYEAIAAWRPQLVFPFTYRSRLRESAAFMQMEEVDGVPNAQTTIELLQRRGELARYGLQPHSGQKHQLRVHMAALGMPILHDRIYPRHHPEPADGVPDYSAPLQLLARSLAFTDPVSGQARAFESRLSLVLPEG